MLRWKPVIYSLFVIFLSSGLEAAPLKIGSPLPGFSLPGTDGKTYSAADISQASAVVVAFWSNSCPFAQSYESRVMALQAEFAGQNVAWVVINANDASNDAAEDFASMQKRAAQLKYPFPYLKDETQAVAKNFGAERTPEVLLFDGGGKLVYQGRIDDNSEAKNVRSQDLKNAIQLILAKTPEKINPPVTKPFGCSIRWK